MLISSDLPLRRSGGSGEKPLVDLTPVETALGFEPRHPLIPLALPRLLAEGLRLGDEGQVRVAFDAPGALPTATGSVDGNDVFYHDVATDTDLLVSPRPLGFQTYTQLRSVESPETFTLRFSLPPGAELHLGTDGSATVARDGASVLSIARPAAVDADGEAVPVAYVVSGDALEVRTSHRGRDFAYPITVDPIVDVPGGGGKAVTEDWTNPSWYTGGWGIDRRGWHAHSYWSGDGTHYWDRYDWPFVYCPTYCSDADYNGLYIKSFWNSLYPSYTQGEWFYPTWGDVYIPRAEFAYIGHYANQSFVRTSIWSGNLNRYVALKDFPTDPWHTEPNWTGIASYNDWTHGSSAAITLVLPAPAGSDSVFREAGPVSYLGGSKIYLQDRSAPTQPAVWGHPVGWVNAATGTWFAKAKDAGLGVKWFRFRYPTGEQWRRHGCSGDRLGPCPGGGRTASDTFEGYAWSHADRGFGGDPFSYDTTGWPEGIQTITMEAIDATDRRSPAETRQVFVDHRGPEIRLSGTLWDRRGQEVFADSYGLSITALDGDASSPQTARSGVRNIQIFVDNKLVKETPQQTCAAGSCAMSSSYTFDPAHPEYEPGLHEVKVVAYDQIGNPSTERFEVSIADQDPLLTEAEFFDQNLTFRREFGFDTDPARVRGIMHNSAYNLARAQYSVPLTSAEAREVEARAAAMEDDAVEDYGSGDGSLDYAGYEMNHSEGGMIDVYFTANHSVHRDRLRSRVSYPERIRVAPATRTLLALEALQAQVDLDETTLSLQGITLVATSIDIPTNKVVVAVARELTPLQRTYLDSRYGDGIQVVVGSVGALNGPARRTSYFGTMMGGMRIDSANGAACTAGFTFDAPVGGPGVTTAGHCTVGPGEPWAQGERYLGDTTARSYEGRHDPVGGVRTTSDGATILTGGGRGATNKVYLSRRNHRAITRIESDRRPRSGSLECISGGYSGFDCGRLVKTVHYRNMVFRLTRSMKCRRGDSGAPIFNGRTAHGTLFGDYREYYSDGTSRTYCAFSHITRLERDLNFRTKTSP